MAVAFLSAELAPGPILAQTPGSRPRLSVIAAVELARSNHPSLREGEALVGAARSRIGLAHLSYRPRADLLMQENQSTRNNISGLLLPQGVLPPISGAVLPNPAGVTRWNSGLGALVSWEPFDFGLRKARMDVAAGEVRQSERQLDLTVQDVALAAADAFLVAVAAKENARAARSNVSRMEVFAATVRTLVANQLRAGADASRAEAELARARTAAIQAQQGAEEARASLGEQIAMGGALPEVDPGPLVTMPPITAPQTVSTTDTPVVRVRAAAIDTAHARLKVADRLAQPRFKLQASLSDRGTGFLPDGRPDPDRDRGLAPDTGNWAVGLSVTINLTDLAERKIRRRIERSTEAAERARLSRTLEALKAQEARARSTLKGALGVAGNTPVQLAAARQTRDQTETRYREGLATVSDVSEAELLLSRSEVEDAIARIGVWRALLGLARVRGDIDSWLDLVRTASHGR